jgi:hypothetical protein
MPTGGSAGQSVLPPPPPKPTLVTVELDGAYIAPGKADGTQWDVGGSVDPAIARDIATALGATNPVAALASVFAGPAVEALEKPDPFGTAMMTITGVPGTFLQPLSSEASPMKDTFAPQWPGPPTWTGVPIDSDIRLRVDLWDADVFDNDSIGVAELNSADLRAALAAKKIIGVRVDDQPPGRILLLTLSVRAE